MVLSEDHREKGLAMLICGEIIGLGSEAVDAAFAPAIAPASLPTLILDGLLLLIGP